MLLQRSPEICWHRTDLLCCLLCVEAERVPFICLLIRQLDGQTGLLWRLKVSGADAPTETVGCMRRVHFKLKSGAYAFTMLEDREFTESDRRPTDNVPNMASSEDAVDESPSTR